jgi:hypothetical protein
MGIGIFAWQHARGVAPFPFNFQPGQSFTYDNAWPILGDECAEDTGLGVYGSKVLEGPTIRDGVGRFAMEVYFKDLATPLLRVRYRYRFEADRVRMWTAVTEACDGGDCGPQDPLAPETRAYVKEPRFVVNVTGGGYKRMAVLDKDEHLSCSFIVGENSPMVRTGQCADPNREWARFDFATTRDDATGGCGSKPCLLTKMQAYPTSGTDVVIGRTPALWQNTTRGLGLDGWARRSSGRASANVTDGGGISPKWDCHGGDPGSQAVRQWEMGGVQSGADLAWGFFNFTGWEGGQGPYDCEPLSRRFGPYAETFGTYAEFSLTGR